MLHMMHALLFALCVLPRAANGLAAPTLWAEKSVWALGCSTPKWDGLVEGTVDEFNSMLPESASRLVEVKWVPDPDNQFRFPQSIPVAL
jgi:Berberine and berberine like